MAEPVFERVPRRSLSAAVLDQLLDRILSGTIAPGEPLPAERLLCEELGVSRTAVRDALARLAELRLIRIRHGGETTVLDYQSEAGLDLLPRLLRGAAPARAAALEAGLEMRMALTPEIARLAAERAGEDTCAALDEVLDAMAAAGAELARLQALSLAFWAEVVRGSDNIAYRLAFNSLREAFVAIRDRVAKAMAPELRDLAGYRAIAAAIRAGDGERAAAAARAHLALGAPGLGIGRAPRRRRRPS